MTDNDNADLNTPVRSERQSLRIIANAVSFAALTLSPAKNKPASEQAIFLYGLGLDRNDIAAMLGLKAQYVSEQVSRAKAKRTKGKKRGKKKDI